MDNGSGRIFRAATLVMAFFVLSRALGLVRQMVMGALFGTSGALDAYMAAARIPEMIFLVVAGGVLGSIFIPTFATYLADEWGEGEDADAISPDAAWRFASTVVNLVLIVVTVLAALMAVLAPALVRMIIAPGFSAAQQATTVRLLRILLLSPIIFGVSGIVMGILNAHQHFLLPALAPSVYNLAIIGGALLLSSRIGVMSLAVGAVVGSLLHLLVQVPGLLRFGARYFPVLDLRNPDVREVGRLMAPRVLGMAVVQLNFVINNSLASRMGVGAVSAINYAWLLMLLPQGVFAQAVGTAAFPTFADQVARGQLRELRADLAGTLRAVLFLSLPSTVGLLVLGRPLISLLFERGAFQASSTEAVAWALAFYALGLAWHALLEIVARAFYALHDTLTPVWVGGVAVAINVGLSLLLPPVFEAAGWPPHGGLALANTVATVVEVTLLLVLIRRRLGGLEGRRTFATAAKSTLAALVMGGLLWGWVGQFSHLGAPLLSAAGILLGALAYLLASLLLRIEEPQRLFWMLLRRERPSVSSPNNVHR